MAYIGKKVEETGLENRTVDTMTGDGSDTTMSLSATPISVNNVLVFFNGVMQRPTTDFTLSGSTITFAAAPFTGAVVVAITNEGGHIGRPSSPLLTEKFMNSAVTNDKISTVAASKLTGAMPALDGTALTGSGTPYTESASDPVETTNPSGGVGTLWVNTTSGEVYCCTNATSNANVWTSIGGGTGHVQNYISATGGSITTNGDYKVHTFNSSGTFTPNIGVHATHGNKVEYLVIAGGGGGGSVNENSNGGGGGGAGGYKTAASFPVTNTGLTVIIGAGGSAAAIPNAGSDSVFSSITSTGGGYGGYKTASGYVGGGTGGSGGGEIGNQGGAGAGTGSEGFAGGDCAQGANHGGGGGGSSAVGADTAAGAGGAGGAGTASDILVSGADIVRAGGGGGGTHAGTAGAGGAGGGGAGGPSNTNGTAGTINFGAGGGGNGSGASRSYPSLGGSGGSGVVIIRYKFQ